MGDRHKSVTKVIFTQVNKIPYAEGWFARICAFLMMILMTYEVLARYLFNKPSGFIDEVVALLLVGIIAAGLGYVMRMGGHIRVDIVTCLFPQRVQKWLRLIVGVISLISCALMCYYFYYEVIDQYQRNVTGHTVLNVKLWMPLAVLFIGFLILLVEVIREVYRDARTLFLHVEERPVEEEKEGGEGI